MSKLATVATEVQGQAAHLEARSLLLELAREQEQALGESDGARVFAGAVKAYLQAELDEPCLHLHSGTHYPACPSVKVSECGRVAHSTGQTCDRPSGHSGPHRLRR